MALYSVTRRLRQGAHTHKWWDQATHLLFREMHNTIVNDVDGDKYIPLSAIGLALGHMVSSLQMRKHLHSQGFLRRPRGPGHLLSHGEGVKMCKLARDLYLGRRASLKVK